MKADNGLRDKDTRKAMNEIEQRKTQNAAYMKSQKFRDIISSLDYFTKNHVTTHFREGILTVKDIEDGVFA